MTSSESEEPTQRRARIAEAIAAHREAGSQSPVLFGSDADERAFVEYIDREVTVRVDDAERDRLDSHLAEFPVFKIAQPATRKAPDGEVHVSALADPKHIADFLDGLFLSVFDQPEGYELVVQEP
jgi:hypothetical protein